MGPYNALESEFALRQYSTSTTFLPHLFNSFLVILTSLLSLDSGPRSAWLGKKAGQCTHARRSSSLQNSTVAALDAPVGVGDRAALTVQIAKEPVGMLAMMRDVCAGQVRRQLSHCNQSCTCAEFERHSTCSAV